MKRAILLAALGVALAACDGPTAGERTLVLLTPNQDDGALSFRISTAAPNEITGATAACDSCEVFLTRVSATELRAIITGNVAAGPIARISVLDGSPNQIYAVSVLEVASRQFAPRADSGYVVSIQP